MQECPKTFAHALGAAIVYNYIDLFGHQSIKKLIVVNEPAVLLVNPAWSDKEKQEYGSIYHATEIHGLTNGFLEDNANILKQNIINITTILLTHNENRRSKWPK